MKKNKEIEDLRNKMSLEIRERWPQEDYHQHISEKDFVTHVLVEDNIKVLMKYPKNSTLQNRFKIFDKFKEIVR